MEHIRIQSLLRLISHILFIGLSFWSIQSLRMDELFRKNRIQQIRLLYLLISVALGYTVSDFFLDFITHSQNLVYFFQ